MKKQLAFDFTIEKENKTITIKREFATPLSLVWDAYTKSELLDQWWAPKPWKAKSKTMNFREGGMWHYAMVGPEGEENWAIEKYETINPNKNFSAVDAFADAEGNVNEELPGACWNISFIDKGENTIVNSVVTFEDVAQLEEILKMCFKDGITMAMEGLDELLNSLNIAKS